MQLTWKDWQRNGDGGPDGRRWYRDTAADSDVEITLYLDPNAEEPAAVTGWFATAYIVGWHGESVDVMRSVELTDPADALDGAQSSATSFAGGVVDGISAEVAAGRFVTTIR